MSDLPVVIPNVPYLAARVDANGISAPSFADILGSLQNTYKSIFGADVYITPDSQDGQLLAIFAKAISDANDATIATYNAYSPSTAVGAGLSSIVKINGIRRKIPTNSTAVVRLWGTAGTTINNGVVSDGVYNFSWALPRSVVIPSSGEIQVTAVCQIIGAVPADIGVINHILTPVPGWQSVSNDSAPAVPGAPTESDAQLRRRQQASVALPAQTVLDGIVGAVWAQDGVVRATGYENPLDYPASPARPDFVSSGLPGDILPSHSIAIVVQGGDVTQICQTIALKKTPGSMTTGDVSQMILDQYGIPNVIRYWQMILVPLTVKVTVTALAGYNSATGNLIRGAVVEFVNRFDVGETSYHNRLFSPANLSGDAATDSSGLTQQQLDALSNTFNILKIEQGIMQPYMSFDVENTKMDGYEVGSWTPVVVLGETDIKIRLQEVFTTDTSYVTVVIA